MKKAKLSKQNQEFWLVKSVIVKKRDIFKSSTRICDTDKAILDPKVGKKWCQRMNRAVFTCEKLCHEAGKVTYQDCHPTFNNSVRDATRRGAVENEVQKHEERLTGAWRQMGTLR